MNHRSYVYNVGNQERVCMLIFFQSMFVHEEINSTIKGSVIS